MAPQPQPPLLLVANALIPIAILIFAFGFFPYKPFIPGLAQYEELPGSMGIVPKAPFDKVVFMVVDALRSDFVYGADSGFSFTQGLIANGAAIPFTAHATSPTVTMPRVKAITTGSIPSFLDVILNIAESDTSSSLTTQDTWLAQMKAKGTGKMIMYGDDTWLKLFPDFFDRADGTTSFFVSDFTEVDNNVTRHVPDELRNDDWNLMVMHYLGLDHIGHKAGPRSSNMIPKQTEMDGIVEQIYSAIESQSHLTDTLLVLLGDHGMTNAGNHGGSAPGETSPALTFISPKLKSISTDRTKNNVPAPFHEEFKYYSTVEQSDIAPTLGGLLGFPVPQNNLGAFIWDFLPFWQSRDEQAQILFRNCRQILNIVTATFSASLFEDDGSVLEGAHASSDIEELAIDWISIQRDFDSSKIDKESVDIKTLEKMKKWLQNAQSMMSSTASNYDMTKLVGGQVLSAIATILALAAAAPILLSSLPSAALFVLITISYGVMMFASSYVEEEHHFWYWASTGWLAILTIRGFPAFYQTGNLLTLGGVGALAGLRLSRRWNQTGQKLAGEPDIARTFLTAHNYFLWDIVGLTYLWNLQSLSSRGFPSLPRMSVRICAAGLLTAVVTFKTAFTMEDSPELIAGLAEKIVHLTAGMSLVKRARIVFGAIGVGLAYTTQVELFGLRKSPQQIKDSMRTIHDLLTLFLITQSRATNIPLFLIFEAMFYFLSNLSLTLIPITITSLVLQYASFFAFGGSNAISSIDLSSAYNGISDYSVFFVGLLTFVSNWAGPIYWVSASSLLLLQLQRNGQKHVLYGYISLMTLFVTTSLFFIMVACTLLRTHLFIWTVFSPKYLYSMAWSLAQHLLVNVGLASLLFLAGSE